MRVNSICIAGPDDTLLETPCCLKALFDTVCYISFRRTYSLWLCAHYTGSRYQWVARCSQREVFYRANRKCGKTSQLGSVEHRVVSVSVSVIVSECAAQPQQQVTACV